MLSCTEIIFVNFFFFFLNLELNPGLFSFYASAPKVPEALCFRVVRPSVRPDFRPDLRPDFFVYALTLVLLDGISSNLVQGSTTRSR